MDNEAIVNQIVKSLSFEVVAEAENVTHVDNLSKSVPLNVKIRVRKKHGVELRHGVISMPRIDRKSGRNEIPERVRLVSSDQTIMNFNVLMEEEGYIDKKHQKQIYTLAPDPQADNVGNTNLAKDAHDFHGSPIISKRNKDILFGKCKPGGCLDPPYSEDRYAYLPAQEDSLSPAKDTAKLKSSSIFKNNIFKRRKRSTQIDDELNSSDIINKNKVDPLKISHDKSSVEPSSSRSNTLITYPHPSDSGELNKQEDKKRNRYDEQPYKKTNSSERSKSSSIDHGSYFMIPKKSRNLSDQSDLNKKLKSYVKPKENNLSDKRNSVNKNILDTSFYPEYSEHTKTDESKATSQNLTFIPILLPVPLNAITKSKAISNDNLNVDVDSRAKISNIVIEDNVRNNFDNVMSPSDLVDQKTANILGSEQLNNLDPNQNQAMIENELSGDDNKTQNLKNIERQDALSRILTKYEGHSDIGLNEEKNYVENFTKIDKSENDKSTNPNALSTSKEHARKSNASNTNNDIKFISKPETDPKSIILSAESREKSVLDIPSELDDQKPSNLKEKQNDIASATLNYNNERYSSSHLEHIYENTQEAPQSAAHVIATNEPVKDDKLDDKLQDLSSRKSSINLEIQERFSKLKRDSEKSVDDISVEGKNFEQKDFQASSRILIDTHNNIDTKENVELISDIYKNIADNKELIDQTDNLEDVNIDEQSANQYKTISDIMLKDNKEIADHFDNFNESYDVTASRGKLIGKVEQTAVLSQEAKSRQDKHNAYLNNSNDFDVSKSGELPPSKDELLTNFSEDDNTTIRGLYQYKSRQSASNQSVMENASYINKAADTLEPSINEKEFIEKSFFTEREKQTQLKNIGKSNESALRHDLNQEPYKNYEPISTSFLRTNNVPWKVDIALQSYIDENNERIIKSYDGKEVPERHINDTLFAANYYLNDESNEIKIPIEHDNDLSVRILKSHRQSFVELNDTANKHRSIREFDYSTDELFGKNKIQKDVSDTFRNPNHQSEIVVSKSEKLSDELRKKKIKINLPDLEVTENYTDYEESNKADTKEYNKSVVHEDLRNALSSIYEKELVPLQDIIKSLREEIDMLVAYQLKIKAPNLTPKRAKSLRLVYPYKKCPCFRRL